MRHNCDAMENIENDDNYNVWVDDIRSGNAPHGNWIKLVRLNQKLQKVDKKLGRLYISEDDPEISRQQRQRIRDQINDLEQTQYYTAIKYRDYVRNRNRYNSFKNIKGSRHNIYGLYRDQAYNPWHTMPEDENFLEESFFRN